MPYKVDWLCDQLIVNFYMYGVITLAEIKQASDEITALQQSGDGMVHVVVDVLDAEKVDVKIPDIKVFFSGIKVSPKHGWVITITDSRIVRFMATLATQFISARERQFSTTEDAIQFIVEIDDRLPSFDELLAKIEASKELL